MSRVKSFHGQIDVELLPLERLHLADWALTREGRLDIPRIKPIARMGYFDYTVVTDTFEMRVPGATSEAEHGLQGAAGMERALADF